MRLHGTKSLRQAALTGTVALVAAAGLVALTGPANAASGKPGPGHPSATSPVKPGLRTEKNGVCETGELCLYFLQNRKGAKFDMFVSDADFSDDVFHGSGAGTGASADNNTRSYVSKDTFYWRVYEGPNSTGREILCIAPKDHGNFSTSDWDTASSASFSSTAC